MTLKFYTITLFQEKYFFTQIKKNNLISVSFRTYEKSKKNTTMQKMYE